MSRFEDQSQEDIQHQLALVLGLVEMPLALEEKLHRDELLRLRAEILRLCGLLRSQPELQQAKPEEE